MEEARSSASRRLRAIAVVACALPQAARAEPHFTDVTDEANVSYVQHAPRELPDCIFPTSCQEERMSGGAAVGDYDGDGDLDLFVTRLDAADILFRNRGDGTFEDVSVAAGLAAFDRQTNGAAFADIDNDGDLDLYVTTIGDAGDQANARNYLFVNNGAGVFTEHALARGAAVSLAGPRRIFSVATGDYDRDGWIDLHSNEWLPTTGSKGRLLRNRGAAAAGYFEDKTGAAGVFLTGVFAFASALTDLDGDGWPDLAVAADFGTSRLYWNDGDGTFTDGTLAAGVGTDENGMGSTFGDYDGDGRPDWFVTSIHDPAQTCETAPCNWGYSGNRLYRNAGGRGFRDETESAGVRPGFWGWGAAFFDYDNDGDLDLVMTNGVDYPGTTVDAAFNADPMRLWRRDGVGTMTEVSAAAGITDTGSGKGLLVFDYDDDGDLDLFVVNNGSTPKLYRNDGGNENAWLRVRAVGATSNREGVGVKVTLLKTATGPVQVREIGAATHFLGQSERIAHFGLGAGSGPVAELRVDWPCGASQTFTNVASRTTLVASEPADPGVCTDADGDGWGAPGSRLCSAGCITDCNDGLSAIHPGQVEICDGVDNDCNGKIDECLPGCTGISGRVEDLGLKKTATTLLELSWGASCAPTDDDYAVYEGTFGVYASHEAKLCSTGGALTATIAPDAGNRYFLVAPRNALAEGSHGTDAAGIERAPAASCRPQVVGACDCGG